MAINKISGNILQDNLLRGANLAIQTDLVFFDIINSRVGINTNSPTVDLTVNGNIYADNLSGNSASITGNIAGGNLNTVGQVVANGNISGSNLVTSGQIDATGNVTAGNLISLGIVTTTGNVIAGNVVVGNILIPTTGNVSVGNVNIVDLSTPVANSDAATKGYVDNLIGNYYIYISDGSTTETINNQDTITFSGIANQITVTVGATDTVTIGLEPTISVDSIISRTTGNINLTAGSTGFVILDGTNGFVIPTGNTAQRIAPSPIGTVRYNTSINQVEVWDGAEWVVVGSDYASITNQYITGDGSTVTFALDQTTTTAAVIVSSNGVVQYPDVAYSVTGNSITFAEAPLSTDVIDVRFTAAVTSLGSISNATGQELTITAPGIVDISTTQSLQLPTYTVAQATVLGNVSAGQVIYVSNGDSGNPCLAVYSAGSWKRVALGATIST